MVGYIPLAVSIYSQKTAWESILCLVSTILVILTSDQGKVEAHVGQGLGKEILEKASRGGFGTEPEICRCYWGREDTNESHA